jgi:hypothetical protein
MNIEVIGTGCPTCKQLYALTLRAAARLGDDAKVAYVAEQAGMKRLMELGLMRSPAIAVDGKIALVGFEPSIDKIVTLIAEAGE